MKFYSLLSQLFFLAGCTCAGLTVYLFFQPQDAPGVGIAEADRELASIAIGQKNEINFRVDNPTRHEISVVGYQFC